MASETVVNSILSTRVDATSPRFEANMRFLADLVSAVRNEEEQIREGGGPKAIESQHSKGRLTARERIQRLIDPGTFFELGTYAAYRMYEEWGGAPAAGVVTGLARVETRLVMIIANDATVKAGAFFPMTSKKVIRAQNIAIENRVPVVRVANTGFSAMVEVDGRIRWRTNLFATDWRVETVRWPGVRTLYTAVGDVFVWLCMAILAVVVLFVIARPRAMSMDGRQPA